MLFIKPDYFDRFRCIASACTRSCCVGWQIEIDEKTREKYVKTAEDGDGFILGAIDTSLDAFLQDEQGRCQMLDENGLCEIIKRYGEGMLCDICREHPRYYNVLPERVEGGLGLCCITAAEGILSMELPPKYVESEVEISTETDNSEKIYSFAIQVREWIEGLLSNDLPLSDIEKRIKNISRHINDYAFDVVTGISSHDEAFISLTQEETISLSHEVNISDDYPLFPVSLTDIEVLPRHKDGWDDFITAAKRSTENEYREKPYREAHRRLIFYFLHRYFVASCEDLSFASRLILSLTLSRLILDVAIIRGATSLFDIAEIASEFSESFEYSTKNIDLILSRLEQN